jgi:hypothetical protein
MWRQHAEFEATQEAEVIRSRERVRGAGALIRRITGSL